MAETRLAVPIRLTSMPQLAEARDLEDDWTGITDAAARRRIQTRLNTRAYRRRKAQQAGQSAASKDVSPAHEDQVPCWVEQEQAISMIPASRALALKLRGGPLIPRNATPMDIIFPLSSDHLITLIQLNVVRACLTNSRLIADVVPPVPRDCTNAAVSIFPGVPDGLELPPNLRPTQLQTSARHGAWIDVLPHPLWRDNIIRALGTFNVEEYGDDILGGLFKGAPASNCEMKGLVVWSEPWHFTSWELSEGFWNKWGWSVRGCDDLLAATNEWRLKRGEVPLGVFK